MLTFVNLFTYEKWFKVAQIICHQKKNCDTNIKYSKEIIIIKQAKDLLKQHCHYGWAWVDFTHAPKNYPKIYKWNFFVHQVHELPKVVQEFILIKLHGETKVWTLRKGTITINIQELTKYRRWLLILVCLSLTLTKIININVKP